MSFYYWGIFISEKLLKYFSYKSYLSYSTVKFAVL